MSSNLVANNLSVSGNSLLSNLTITGNETIGGSLTANSISSNNIAANVVNCSTLTTTNETITNQLSIPSTYPLKFTSGGQQYQMNSNNLLALYNTSGAAIATEAYVQNLIYDVSGASILNNLQSVANYVLDSSGLQQEILSALGTAGQLTYNNAWSGVNTFNNSVNINGTLNANQIDISGNLNVLGQINNLDITLMNEQIQSNTASATANNSQISNLYTIVIPNIDISLNTINNEVADIYTKIGDIDVSLNTINGDIQNIDSSLNTLFGDIKDINNTTSNLQGEINVINTITFPSVDASINVINGDIQNIDSSLNTLFGDIKDINNTTSNLQGEINTINTTLSDVPRLDAVNTYSSFNIFNQGIRTSNTTTNGGILSIGTQGGVSYIESGSNLNPASGNRLYFTDMYAANVIMAIDTSNHFVGINNPLPSQALHVSNGNIQVDNGSLYLGTTNVGTDLQNINNSFTSIITDISNIDLSLNSINSSLLQVETKILNINNYNDNATITQPNTEGGVVNVLGIQIITPPNYKKQITFQIPISHYRNFLPTVFGSSNKITETTNAITFSIYKNGVVWNGTFSYSFTTSFPLVQTINVTNPSVSNYLFYNSFLGTATVTFTPDNENTTDTYIGSFSYDGLYQSNMLFTDYGNGLNTNTLNSGFIVSSTSNISNVVTSPVPQSYYTASNYNTYFINPSTDNGTLLEVDSTLTTYQLYTNNINTTNASVTNVSSTNVTASNVTATSVTASNLFANTGILGYMFNGVQSQWQPPFPFAFSMNGIAAVDDYWLLMPKVNITLYTGTNYTGISQTFNNENGTTSQLFQPLNHNTTQSFRVFYNGIELTYPPIS